MGKILLRDPLGVEVTLTDERWQHILEFHPVMADHRQDLEETITEPGVVFEKEGDRFYFRPVQSKHFGPTFVHARAVQSDDYFVVTAWLMPEIKVPEGAQAIWLKLMPR